MSAGARGADARNIYFGRGDSRHALSDEHGVGGVPLTGTFLDVE